MELCNFSKTEFETLPNVYDKFLPNNLIFDFDLRDLTILNTNTFNLDLKIYRYPDTYDAYEPEGDECEDGKYVTEKQYWECYYEHPQYRYEYNNGKLEVKGMASLKSYKNNKNLSYLMGHYLKKNKIGELIGMDIGFKLKLSDGTISIRKPDLAIVLNNNPVIIKDDDRSYKGTFDLCIEMLSDSTKKIEENDTVVKVKEYEDVGVKEYFIIDSNQTYTQFYRRNKKGLYNVITPINGVIESEVLPGFKFRIDDLYKQTLDIEDLINDVVYKDYVELEFQAERKAKEDALTRAEKAEKDKAEILAEYEALKQMLLKLETAKSV